MYVLIMSDIHGNISALDAVLENVQTDYQIEKCILLGDLIDYGMNSNDVVDRISLLPYPIVCNIWGNHERAIFYDDYSRFASERGKQCAKYTRNILSEKTWKYLESEMISAGQFEFTLYGKRCLAVHGSIDDCYWGKIPGDGGLDGYQKYDYVFSGHSHISHFFEKFYKVNNQNMRNQKKTIFINPGSVGQPRNHNPMAQFVILDIHNERIFFDKVMYDIKKEQSFYHGQVDNFYKTRLEAGI